MLQKIQYLYFYHSGRLLMLNYLRATNALTEHMDLSEREKIQYSEIICPGIVNYRTKGLSFARKAAGLKIKKKV